MGAVTSAFIVHPVLPYKDRNRSADDRLEEAAGLAFAIGLEIISTEIVQVPRPSPAMLFGSGKVEEIKRSLSQHDTGSVVVIVDDNLTPVQHRNLEKAWDAKVLDRTALILEIFGERANTSEGRLQVELAHLMYQRSRLVRSWTHLERQRGGAGFLGGPGERQIESDRRMLDDKIVRLKKKLAEVTRTRGLQRAQRKKAPYPIVAFVGYTNAGKSTLFNHLTHGGVLAEDMLFATLDPTMRAYDLPSKMRIILSDTVGFVSDLPTQLVAAFRATLEEVLEADVIVHVRDIAHKNTEEQKRDVVKVLRELGVEHGGDTPIIEALNKIDLLDVDERRSLEALVKARDLSGVAECHEAEDDRVLISAVTGEGVDALISAVEEQLTRAHKTYSVQPTIGDGAARAWLHDKTDILSEQHTDDGPRLVVRASDKVINQFKKTFPDVTVLIEGKAARIAVNEH